MIIAMSIFGGLMIILAAVTQNRGLEPTDPPMNFSGKYDAFLPGKIVECSSCSQHIDLETERSYSELLTPDVTDFREQEWNCVRCLGN